jgi:hypothetical protein
MTPGSGGPKSGHHPSELNFGEVIPQSWGVTEPESRAKHEGVGLDWARSSSFDAICIGPIWSGPASLLSPDWETHTVKLYAQLRRYAAADGHRQREAAKTIGIILDMVARMVRHALSCASGSDAVSSGRRTVPPHQFDIRREPLRHLNPHASQADESRHRRVPLVQPQLPAD